MGTKAGSIAIIAAMAWLIAGCGDDDDAGSHQTEAGVDSSAPDSGDAKPAPSNAGKPCKSSADCDGDLCATRIKPQPDAPISAAPDGYCTKKCKTNAECGSGAACEGGVQAFTKGSDTAVGDSDTAGLCMDKCTGASECRNGYLCAQGLAFDQQANADTCVPVPPTDHPADGVVGKACKADADCKGGRCLTMQWDFAGGAPLPGGYCSGRCVEDNQCGAGAICVYRPLPGPLTGTCQQSCKDDADCTRDGYGCSAASCLPVADPLPDGSVGKPCKDDSECSGLSSSCASSLPADGLLSVTRERWRAYGGYCTGICTNSSDCGAGGVCLTTSLDSVGNDQICYARCSSQDDCRDGYSCRPREDAQIPLGDAHGGEASPKVCTPDQPDEDAGTSM